MLGYFKVDRFFSQAGLSSWRRAGDPPTRGYICSATSSDGVSWEKDPSPVLAPDSAWDGVKCSEPDIVELDGGGFRLFYEACDGTAEGETGVWRILGASSRRAAL